MPVSDPLTSSSASAPKRHARLLWLIIGTLPLILAIVWISSYLIRDYREYAQREISAAKSEAEKVSHYNGGIVLQVDKDDFESGAPAVYRILLEHPKTKERTILSIPYYSRHVAAAELLIKGDRLIIEYDPLLQPEANVADSSLEYLIIWRQ